MTKTKEDCDFDFKFHRHDDIGSAAAEDDTIFLPLCFVDTGDIGTIADCENPKRIVVGRTGSGKSALIRELGEREENVITLSPYELSLNFIANNDVIGFFEEAGVNLSMFYSLLWRHVLVVELLKKKFKIRNEEGQKTYMQHLRKMLYKKDKIKEQAVDYLENWGNKFWLTTEERLKELTSKIEKNLEGAISGSLPGVELSINGAKRLTTEQRSEVVQRARKAVSDVQIRELENIIAVLADEIFNDPQERYYITIDKLDEEWVDDRIKLHLIKSLIDTVRRFRRIPSVKIVIAIRQDLLDKVIHSSVDPGFQEEKYESLYVDLKWTKSQLLQLVDRRVSQLVKRRYTKCTVGYSDIFPEKIDKEKSFDYLISRTFHRPRDIIMFVNECILEAADCQRITAHIVKKAEEQYSYKRLRSLATEWQGIYPNLYQLSQIFFGMKESFLVGDITKEWIDEKYLEVVSELDAERHDPVRSLIDSLYKDGGANFGSVRNSILREFYITGLIGLKTGTSSSVNWSHLSRYSLAPGQVRPNSIVHIHPTFYRALDIKLHK